MSVSKRLTPACVAAAAALAAALAVGAPAGATTATSAPPSGATKPPPSEHALLRSRELWATIDVCNPPDQPDTVGVRGSMPGNGQAHDRMYMSFRLQYMTANEHWANLAGAASSGFVAVGGGASPRQGGSSFALKPVAGKPAVTLRGVVDFQWRRGGTVLVSTAVPTSAGHKSLAGADPANFSAASCVLS